MPNQWIDPIMGHGMQVGKFAREREKGRSNLRPFVRLDLACSMAYLPRPALPLPFESPEGELFIPIGNCDCYCLACSVPHYFNVHFLASLVGPHDPQQV